MKIKDFHHCFFFIFMVLFSCGDFSGSNEEKELDEAFGDACLGETWNFYQDGFCDLNCSEPDLDCALSSSVSASDSFKTTKLEFIEIHQKMGSESSSSEIITADFSLLNPETKDNPGIQVHWGTFSDQKGSEIFCSSSKVEVSSPFPNCKYDQGYNYNFNLVAGIANPPEVNFGFAGILLTLKDSTNKGIDFSLYEGIELQYSANEIFEIHIIQDESDLSNGTHRVLLPKGEGTVVLTWSAFKQPLWASTTQGFSSVIKEVTGIKFVAHTDHFKGFGQLDIQNIVIKKTANSSINISDFKGEEEWITQSLLWEGRLGQKLNTQGFFWSADDEILQGESKLKCGETMVLSGDLPAICFTDEMISVEFLTVDSIYNMYENFGFVMLGAYLKSMDEFMNASNFQGIKINYESTHDLYFQLISEEIKVEYAVHQVILNHLDREVFIPWEHFKQPDWAPVLVDIADITKKLNSFRFQAHTELFLGSIELKIKSMAFY